MVNRYLARKFINFQDLLYRSLFVERSGCWPEVLNLALKRSWFLALQKHRLDVQKNFESYEFLLIDFKLRSQVLKLFAGWHLLHENLQTPFALKVVGRHAHVVVHEL